MMMKKRPLAVLIGQVFGLVALAAAVGVAQAQQVASERITVTGSRIPQPNLSGYSPVTVVGADDIKVEGVTNIENLLNNLPQVFADQGNAAANGATGTSTVNLRNLGPDRTLVLMNGRRLPPGGPDIYAPDLNQIPPSLIERIEVLTGGASAVYGSDAIAGVVNFIMKKNFEGVQFDINHSFSQHEQHSGFMQGLLNAKGIPVPGDVSDGKSNDVSVTMGSNFAGNKGNATFFLGYKDEKAVLQGDRDYSACALNYSGAGVPSCGGSSNGPRGRILDNNTGDSYTLDAVTGLPRAYRSSDAYNYAPQNYYKRPAERYTAASYIHYDITPKTTAYAEFNFADDHTVAQIAPSGAFLGSGGLGVPGSTARSGVYRISDQNPFLTANWRALFPFTVTDARYPGENFSEVLIGRRAVELGGRQDDLRHTTFRSVFGFKGDINDVWKYDAFLQKATVTYLDVGRNQVSNTKLIKALDAVTVNGQAACRSVADGSDPNCAPLNIWTAGGVSAAALKYISLDAVQSGETTQRVISGTVNGDLGKYGIQTPWAKSGVLMAVGLEQRKETLLRDADVSYQTIDLSGSTTAVLPTSGKITVKEYFGELNIPIVEGREWAYAVTSNLTYRRSEYDGGTNTDTYGLGLDWAPVKALRLRGGYQRAVRAPNLIDLYAAHTGNLFDSGDPCEGPTPTASAAACARTGLAAARYGNVPTAPTGQYNYLQGGNTALKPETADTKTLGFVFAPESVKGLHVTADYFDIKVKDLISSYDPGLSLQACIDTGNPVFCNRIHRDGLGTLWAGASTVDSLNENLGSQQTTGIDFSADYTLKIQDLGRLRFDISGVYVKKLETVLAFDTGTYDCVGLFSGVCATPVPKWRHKARVSWFSPWNVDVALTWRHIDSVEQEVTSSNPILAGRRTPWSSVPDYDYFDLSASWSITDKFTLRGGINNLFDKDPPVFNSNTVGPSIFGNGNTFPQVYDALGRYMFVNLTAKF